MNALTADADFADGNAVLPVLGLACILTTLALGGVWVVRELPASLRELWRLVGDWVVIHEVAREVDCAPWGLQRKFKIVQDHGATVQDRACPWAPGPGQKWAFGLSLWNGGVALSRVLVEQQASLAAGAFAQGRSVIELGCGQALVSMVALALFPHLRRVVATDGSEEVLLAAKANVTANVVPGAKMPELASLFWGCREDIQRALALNDGAPYDVVLGADITYMEGVSELVSTIVELSHCNTEVWITHEPRRRSTDHLVKRLRTEFRSVEEFPVCLAPKDIGRSEAVSIVAWHCVGKKAA